MRAVQITRFGGPEGLDVVDLLDPEPGPGEELFEVSAADINLTGTRTTCRSTDLTCGHSDDPSRPGHPWDGLTCGIRP